jgi:putative phosphonate metabolism protein
MVTTNAVAHAGVRPALSAPPAGDARYAIYFAPRRESAWWAFGCAWLGRDPITDSEVARPAIATLDAATIAHITAAPRRYGFHATLKPPFRLARGYRARDVYLQAANLAASLKATALPPLRLTEIDGFVALALAGDDAGDESAGGSALAAQCVSCFDNLRATAEAAELARRHAAGLSARQMQLLAAWGYPYVFEEFRFHLTLTGRLPQAQRRRVIDALHPVVAELQAAPLLLDALTVYLQPQRDAPFVVTRRYGFDGSVEIYRDDDA